MKAIESGFEKLIFSSRWLQAPLYGGLVVAGCLYAYKSMIELGHLAMGIHLLTEEKVMLSVLGLVDVTMVANLLIMVIIGGYSTFVSKLDLRDSEDRPDWLRSVDAGSLKVKLAGSLAGVSGIHLLKSFVDIKEQKPEHIQWQIIIHLVFLASTLLLAVTEWVLHKTHRHDGAADS
ncbi:MAG: TIGR00645 family protein [Pedosphaera sp.]|nr:TIGR00645 family protein [Pedosphaera sp.]